MHKNGIILKYSFDLSMYSCIFFVMGTYSREYNVLDNCIKKNVMIYFSIIVVIFLGSFYFKDSLPMNFPTRKFDKFSVNILGVICCTYLCYVISKFLEATNILKRMFMYIGKRTYCILILHFFVFKLLFGIGILLNIYPMDYLKELVPKYSPGLQWIIFTILTILLCIIISTICERSIIFNYIFNARLNIIKEKKCNGQ